MFPPKCKTKAIGHMLRTDSALRFSLEPVPSLTHSKSTDLHPIFHSQTWILSFLQFPPELEDPDFVWVFLCHGSPSWWGITVSADCTIYARSPAKGKLVHAGIETEPSFAFPLPDGCPDSQPFSYAQFWYGWMASIICLGDNKWCTELCDCSVLGAPTLKCQYLRKHLFSFFNLLPKSRPSSSSA